MSTSASAMRVSPDPARFWAGELLRDGYCIIPDLLPVAMIAALHGDLKPRLAQTPFCEGNFFGCRTKRFGGLLKRSPHAATLVQHPLILDVMQIVLGPWCDRFQLNLTQAIEIWNGELEQVPHRDQDMWRVARGETEYLVNVMWPLTPFREENGATLLWPGTHGSYAGPKPPRSAAVAAQMDPGAALLFLGSTLHGGGGNRTEAPRTGMIASYSLGWLRTYENQFLVYPPEIARRFPPELAGLIGYQQHLPSLGNYEGQCPSIVLHGDVPDYVRFTDALRDEQVKPLAEYRARLLASQKGTS
ncbi:MAG: phytanoyl-CoA dioxygenase family protein [Rhizomicrobium sp.]